MIYLEWSQCGKTDFRERQLKVRISRVEMREKKRRKLEHEQKMSHNQLDLMKPNVRVEKIS